MDRKKEIRQTFAHALALAELAFETPHAREIRKQHLNGCCCENVEMDNIVKELAAGYTGEETPASLGFIENLDFSIDTDVSTILRFEFTLLETLNEAVERCFQLCKVQIIKSHRKEIAAWGITSQDLFPDESSSIH